MNLASSELKKSRFKCHPTQPIGGAGRFLYKQMSSSHLSGHGATGLTREVGRTGCYVVRATTFDSGAIMQLRLMRDRISFHTLACIARVVPGRGLDLEFLETEPEQLELLEAWIDELSGATSDT
jgi:hypothetical protein